MTFELSNEQRPYFGLEPVDPSWDRVLLGLDRFGGSDILYFDGDIIRRHIFSSDWLYKEEQDNIETRDRNILLPKTARGKERKLTLSTLESVQPIGVYCQISASNGIIIASYTTQTTLYDDRWERQQHSLPVSIQRRVTEFISTAPTGFLTQADAFKRSKREKQTFKPGDFFAFRINRSEYGYGRVLLDIHKLKKDAQLPAEHGLGFIMARPVLVKMYAYISTQKNIDIALLANAPAMPSDYMMDNLLFYGHYEVIGHKPLSPDEMDLPISYGQHIHASRNTVYLQWGLIHKELSSYEFNKYLTARNPLLPTDSPSHIATNPYSCYGIGIYPEYDSSQIRKMIANGGIDNHSDHPTFNSIFDLRTRANEQIRNELLRTFGLDPDKGYEENCALAGIAANFT